MKQGIRLYGWLFGVNLFISTFTFGGGYVVFPMVRRYFVAKKTHFTEEDLINMAAVAQSTPGAIAVNLSALAGYRVAGLWGALASCLGAVIPPLVILTAVSAFYKVFVTNMVLAAVLKGMEAGVAALMVDLIVDMCALILKQRSLFLSVMIPLSWIANFLLGIHVVVILVVCCVLCILQVVIKRGKA